LVSALAQFSLSADTPWRPEHRRRLAAGLAAVGSVVLLFGMGAPLARASSPDAWRAYDGEVRRACVKASRLLQPRALGERIDVPVADVSSSGITLSISAFLIAGRYPHAPMRGQMDRELCLFEQRTRRAKESANSAPSGYDDETIKELTTWEIISIHSED
jgi:hypothetical protein